MAFLTHDVIFQSSGKQHCPGYAKSIKWTLYLSLTWFPLPPPPPTFSPLSSEPSFCHFLSDCLKTHVFVYLHRRSGTLILRSSYYYILKNIAYVGLICNFDPNCIFVFVFVYMYLCICIFVCADQTPGNIDFQMLLPLSFQKYSTCHVYLQFLTKQYLCICVFVFVYLVVQDSPQIDQNFLLPVRFLQFFCPGTINARFLLK